MYGESGDVIGVLSKLKLPFIVAIRSNHPVWLLPGQRVRHNRWRTYEQKLSHRQAEQRFIREIIFGKRHPIRYYQISKSSDSNPKSEDTWFIMMNLLGNIQIKLAQLYSLRNWIEYGFKQVKNELGWADFRLTNYTSIERWWEIVFSVYLLVSLQATHFKSVTIKQSKSNLSSPSPIREFSQHP